MLLFLFIKLVFETCSLYSKLEAQININNVWNAKNFDDVVVSLQDTLFKLSVNGTIKTFVKTYY